MTLEETFKKLLEAQDARIELLSELIFWQEFRTRVQQKHPKVYEECFDLGRYIELVGKI